VHAHRSIIFYVHVIEDFTDRTSAIFVERCGSLSIWCVIPILEVFRLLLSNEGTWEPGSLGANSLRRTTRA